MSRHAITLEDLITRFQSTSESLERSYRELQGRVQLLSAELEREREERIRLERLAATGEMAMEVVREIRNPLESIELYASMLEGEYAAKIVRTTRLLNHSITNVVQFGMPTKLEAERISVCRLLEGIRDFLQPTADQKRIRIESGCDSDCYAMADHEFVHRMLLTLVRNVLLETATDGTVRLTASVAGCDIVIEVEDTATGIHDEAPARIFDPMTSATEGLGHGWPIVQGMVESHDGSIHMESSEQGRRFLICLRNAAMDGRRSNTEVVSESTAGCRR
jgi:signal transduction histidine kinase